MFDQVLPRSKGALAYVIGSFRIKSELVAPFTVTETPVISYGSINSTFVSLVSYILIWK